MPVTYMETLPELGRRQAELHRWRAKCDQPNCNFSVGARSAEAGERSLSIHTCPYSGGTTKIGWLMLNPTTLEKAWIALDAAVTELMEGKYEVGTQASSPEDPERVRLKGVCRGMAEIIAMFMGPHFTTADQISAEAAKRYKAKKAGEEYETVGLGGLRMTPPPGTDKYSKTVLPTAPRSSTPVPKPSTFTEEEIGNIKFAAESGMFTTEQLAKTYKVRADVIEAVIKK